MVHPQYRQLEQLEQLPDFSILASERSLTLDFPEDWLQEHPLTSAELTTEQGLLEKFGLELTIS